MSAVLQLQQHFDIYLDARKHFDDVQAQRREAVADEVDTEALRLAEKIVRDPAKLTALVMHGDLPFHEVTVKRRGRDLTLEQAICEEISWSMQERRSDFRCIADQLIEQIAQTTDVRAEAEKSITAEDAFTADYSNDFL